MTDLAVLTTRETLSQWRNSIGSLPVVLVPTMGALHAGHMELVNAAHAYLKIHHNGRGRIVVSIFVNPIQFTNAQDFESYPATLGDDIELCAHHGVDVVFAPTVQEIYPHGLDNVQLLTAGKHATTLEGKDRPGHFDGVVTVVQRLFDYVQPVAAFFGEKDFQQLVVIRNLAERGSNTVEIIAIPTVRDSDGIALSSRNKRLSITGRGLAKQIPAAIALSKHVLAEGGSLASAVAAGRNYLDNQPGICLEYFEIRTEELDEITQAGTARLLVAATIGDVRLIDNVPLEIGEENVISN